MSHWSEALPEDACSEAVEWARTQPSLAVAWKRCKRADWLLWILGRLPKTNRKKLVLAACACARTALKYVPKGEERPLAAIRTAERWAHGKATLTDVRSAYAAAAAAYDAAAYDAAYAAVAYAAAAYAAYDAAYAYDAAVYAADADYAADAAVYAAARSASFARMAKLVRKHFPKPPRLT